MSKPPEKEEPKGIGVAGTVVLLLTTFAILAFYIGTHPHPNFSLHLPDWIDLQWDATPNQQRAVAPPESPPATIVAPRVVPPPPPQDPYEEISSTRMDLHGTVQLDVRVRLVPGKSIQEVEPLLRSRLKNLRSDAASVMLRLYAVGSEGLAADVPLVTFTAAKPGGSTPEQTPQGAAEVEPGIFRAPPQ